jgi:hypothetical protein
MVDAQTGTWRFHIKLPRKALLVDWRARAPSRTISANIDYYSARALYVLLRAKLHEQDSPGSGTSSKLLPLPSQRFQ